MRETGESGGGIGETGKARKKALPSVGGRQERNVPAEKSNEYVSETRITRC